jgi:L-methionine (R)-S-oxide reductase
MKNIKKEGRYERVHIQLSELLINSSFSLSRIATAIALLHNKFDYFFWTGAYFLYQNELCVGPYQGSLACQVLKKNTGVCWSGINQGKTIIVPDVHTFPGHIACDSRSNSEIVLPLFNTDAQISGVLDIDSEDFAAFDETDAFWLEKIIKLVGPIHITQNYYFNK